jgi:hypothetical protein
MSVAQLTERHVRLHGAVSAEEHLEVEKLRFELMEYVSAPCQYCRFWILKYLESCDGQVPVNGLQGMLALSEFSKYASSFVHHAA